MANNVLQDRNFSVYLAGNTVSWIGTWMQRTAIGWLSWELTESASWVGAIVLAQYLPLVFIAPLFGVLIDRTDRRRYAILCQSLQIILSLGLFAIHACGYLNIYALLACCLLLGVGNAAYQPIRLTLIHDIAPAALLTQAIGINSIAFNATRLIGPGIGGVSIAALGVGYTFLINSITFIATLYALIVISIRKSEESPTSGGVFSQLVAGVRYIAADARILELMALSVTVSILARGVLELLPAFAGGVFDSGSSGLATMMAVAGAGGIAAGLLLSGATEQRVLTRLVTVGCAFLGIFIALLGVTEHFPVALVVVFGAGATATLASVGMQAILQADLDSAYRGRVVSLWGMTTVSGPAFGGAILGAAAQLADLRTVTVFSGIACTLICVSIMRRSPFFSLRGYWPAS